MATNIKNDGKLAKEIKGMDTVIVDKSSGAMFLCKYDKDGTIYNKNFEGGSIKFDSNSFLKIDLQDERNNAGEKFATLLEKGDLTGFAKSVLENASDVKFADVLGETKNGIEAYLRDTKGKELQGEEREERLKYIDGIRENWNQTASELSKISSQIRDVSTGKSKNYDGLTVAKQAAVVSTSVEKLATVIEGFKVVGELMNDKSLTLESAIEKVNVEKGEITVGEYLASHYAEIADKVQDSEIYFNKIYHLEYMEKKPGKTGNIFKDFGTKYAYNNSSIDTGLVLPLIQRVYHLFKGDVAVRDLAKVFPIGSSIAERQYKLENYLLGRAALDKAKIEKDSFDTKKIEALNAEYKEKIAEINDKIKNYEKDLNNRSDSVSKELSKTENKNEKSNDKSNEKVENQLQSIENVANKIDSCREKLSNLQYEYDKKAIGILYERKSDKKAEKEQMLKGAEKRYNQSKIEINKSKIDHYEKLKNKVNGDKKDAYESKIESLRKENSDLKDKIDHRNDKNVESPVDKSSDEVKDDKNVESKSADTTDTSKSDNVESKVMSQNENIATKVEKVNVEKPTENNLKDFEKFTNKLENVEGKIDEINKELSKKNISDEKTQELKEKLDGLKDEKERLGAELKSLLPNFETKFEKSQDVNVEKTSYGNMIRDYLNKNQSIISKDFAEALNATASSFDRIDSKLNQAFDKLDKLDKIDNVDNDETNQDTDDIKTKYDYQININDDDGETNYQLDVLDKQKSEKIASIDINKDDDGKSYLDIELTEAGLSAGLSKNDVLQDLSENINIIDANETYEDSDVDVTTKENLHETIEEAIENTKLKYSVETKNTEKEPDTSENLEKLYPYNEEDSVPPTLEAEIEVLEKEFENDADKVGLKQDESNLADAFVKAGKLGFDAVARVYQANGFVKNIEFKQLENKIDSKISFGKDGIYIDSENHVCVQLQTKEIANDETSSEATTVTLKSNEDNKMFTTVETNESPYEYIFEKNILDNRMAIEKSDLYSIVGALIEKSMENEEGKNNEIVEIRKNGEAIKDKAELKEIVKDLKENFGVDKKTIEKILDKVNEKEEIELSPEQIKEIIDNIENSDSVETVEMDVDANNGENLAEPDADETSEENSSNDEFEPWNEDDDLKL